MGTSGINSVKKRRKLRKFPMTVRMFSSSKFKILDQAPVWIGIVKVLFSSVMNHGTVLPVKGGFA